MSSSNYAAWSLLILGAVLACKKPTSEQSTPPPTTMLVPQPVLVPASASAHPAAPSAAVSAAPLVVAEASAAPTIPPAPAAAPQVSAPDQAGFVTLKFVPLGVELEVPEALATKRAPNRVGNADLSAVLELKERTPHQSLDDWFSADSVATPKRTVAFKLNKKVWFVVSGLEGKKVYYEKTAELGQRTVSFTFTYPQADKAEWDGSIKRIADSFRVIGAAAPKLAKGTCRNDSDCDRGFACTGGGFCTARME